MQNMAMRQLQFLHITIGMINPATKRFYKEITPMVHIATQSRQALDLADADAIGKQVGLVDPWAIAVPETPDAQLDQQATTFVQRVLSLNPDELSAVDAHRQNAIAVQALGCRTQKEAAWRVAILKAPIRKLSKRGENGGKISHALESLKVKLEELDPGQFEIKAGWFSRNFGFLPGIGSPLQRFFTRLESTQSEINAHMHAMAKSAEALQCDNLTLSQDQRVMRELTLRLQKTIELGLLIDRKLSAALEHDMSADDPRRHLLGDDILLALRQRIQDLRQQLAVNQQGVLAIAIIIRNNEELIKGLDRGIDVIVNALNMAASVALVLTNQNLVLDRIDAMNNSTRQLCAQSASDPPPHDAERHQPAGDAQLNMETLKMAFDDISAALGDIASFCQKALPQMADTILAVDTLSKSNESAIQRMETGTRAAPIVALEVA